MLGIGRIARGALTSGRGTVSLRRVKLLAFALAVVVVAGCDSTHGDYAAAVTGDAAVRDFSFARDTFAFPNEIRAFSDDRPDLYANYCFVVARGLRQFFQFARFDPAAPRLDRAAYVDLVRRVAARPPWRTPI